MKLLDTIAAAKAAELEAKAANQAALNKMSDDIFEIINNAIMKEISILHDDSNCIEMIITSPFFREMVDNTPTAMMSLVWTIMKNDHPEILDVRRGTDPRTVYLKIKK